MFIRYGIKKVTYGLVVLVATSSVEVHCSSYDYLKSTLPYAAVLAFIATNYYRRSLAQSLNAYDSLSYALPVVAAGAGSLLAQPDNWRGAFVRSLPAMLFALGAMGLERMKTPSLGNNPDETISKRMPATIETPNLSQHQKAVSLSPQPVQKVENKAFSGEPSTSMTRDLPIEIISPSLMQEIEPRHQDQPPIGQKVETREDIGRFFLNQKKEFEKLLTQYNQQINQIDDNIDNIFSNVVQKESVLTQGYAQANQYYKELQTVYNELQVLADKIKESTQEQEKIKLIDTMLNSVTKSMSDIVDPMQVVAIAAYTNALINEHYKSIGDKEINHMLIIDLMPKVLNIQEFFGSHDLSLHYEVADLIKRVAPSVEEKLKVFKSFDQETFQRLNKFSTLNYLFNQYLRDNEKNEFQKKLGYIKDYYDRMVTWYQEHDQKINRMSLRVAHIFKKINSLDQVNIYQNMISMLQLPWQDYAIALLQHHYTTRKKKSFKNYQQLLQQARKDNYINQNQYDQLDAFIRAAADNPTLQAAINWWLDILIGIDEDEQTVRSVKGGNETSSVLGRGKSKKVGRRR